MYKCKICGEIKGDMVRKDGTLLGYRYCICELTKKKGKIDLRGIPKINTRED